MDMDAIARRTVSYPRGRSSIRAGDNGRILVIAFTRSGPGPPGVGHRPPADSAGSIDSEVFPWT
ncbi:hypothetical protein SBRY_11062 [Actinacidiphila bryophytorum]|uniref:Uncharacterized protein n=1 Tax=Actinacidiphila bryophytorum TaxID=1436133 RepID=A0A9W4E2Z1_9ACTN|nr:hypothetical protein SBRY_11062 [Actinacidiphila bryophytorum]